MKVRPNNQLEVLAIIPSRLGSKGLPGKNTKLFCGEPLISWTIKEIKNSDLISRAIISSNDQEAISIAKSSGIEVPFVRPSNISGDLATDIEFIQHALLFLQKNQAYSPDIVVRLPPTSPLRTAKHIDQGVKTLINTSTLDSVRPVCKVSHHPYKYWTMDDDNVILKPFLDKSVTGFKEPANLPRQLFPTIYRHTGAADFIWTKTIKEKNSASGDTIGYFLMDDEDSVNIDSELDFLFAEFLMKKRLSQTSL